MSDKLPQNPYVGQVSTLGNKSWYWDGLVWRRYYVFAPEDIELTYMNPEPVPVTVGGIEAGWSFEEKVPLQDMWTMLLYPYMQPSLFNLRIEGVSTSLGYFEEIPANSIFRWDTTNSQSIVANSIKITNVNTGEVLVEEAKNTHEYSHQFSEAIRLSWGESQEFLIEAKAKPATEYAEEQTISDTLTITWNKVHTTPEFTLFSFNGEEGSINLYNYEDSHEGSSVDFDWNTNQKDYIAEDSIKILDNNGEILEENLGTEGPASVALDPISSGEGLVYTFTIQGEDVIGTSFSETFSIHWGDTPQPSFTSFRYEGESEYTLFYYKQTPENPTFSWTISNSEFVLNEEIRIIDEDSETEVYSGSMNPGEVTLSLDALGPKSIGSTYTYRIEADNKEGNPVTPRTVTIRWIDDDYNKPEFSSFTASPNSVDQGDTVDTITFSWSINHVGNIKKDTIKIFDITDGAEDEIYSEEESGIFHHAGGSSSSSVELTELGYHHSDPKTRNFRIQVEHDRENPEFITRETSVKWEEVDPEAFRVRLFIQLTDPAGVQPSSSQVSLNVNGFSSGSEFLEGTSISLGTSINDDRWTRDYWTSEDVTIDNPSTSNAGFTMPAHNVDVTCYIIPPYLVSLSKSPNYSWGSLSGAGIYNDGDTVEITITDFTSSDGEFIDWTGVGGIEDSESTETNFTMPAEPVNITANLRGKFSLSLQSTDNLGDLSGGGDYLEGESVTINIENIPGDYNFTNWSIVSGSASGFPISNEEATFTMPANNLTLRANIEEPPPPPDYVYYGALPDNDSNQDLSSLNQDEGLINSFYLYANTFDFMVFACPQDLFNGDTIGFNMSGLSANMIKEGTQTIHNRIYNVYFSGLLTASYSGTKVYLTY